MQTRDHRKNKEGWFVIRQTATHIRKMSDSEDVVVPGKKSRISVLKSEECAHNDVSGDEIVCHI